MNTFVFTSIIILSSIFVIAQNDPYKPFYTEGGGYDVGSFLTIKKKKISAPIFTLKAFQNNVAFREWLNIQSEPINAFSSDLTKEFKAKLGANSERLNTSAEGSINRIKKVTLDVREGKREYLQNGTQQLIEMIKYLPTDMLERLIEVGNESYKNLYYISEVISYSKGKKKYQLKKSGEINAETKQEIQQIDVSASGDFQWNSDNTLNIEYQTPQKVKFLCVKVSQMIWNAINQELSDREGKSDYVVTWLNNPSYIDPISRSIDSLTIPRTTNLSVRFWDNINQRPLRGYTAKVDIDSNPNYGLINNILNANVVTDQDGIAHFTLRIPHSTNTSLPSKNYLFTYSIPSLGVLSQSYRIMLNDGNRNITSNTQNGNQWDLTMSISQNITEGSLSDPFIIGVPDGMTLADINISYKVDESSQSLCPLNPGQIFSIHTNIYIDNQRQLSTDNIYNKGHGMGSSANYNYTKDNYQINGHNISLGIINTDAICPSNANYLIDVKDFRVRIRFH